MEALERISDYYTVTGLDEAHECKDRAGKCGLSEALEKGISGGVTEVRLSERVD